MVLPIAFIGTLHSTVKFECKVQKAPKAKDFSMTTLLTHTVAHSTKPTIMPKSNNQPPKKLS